MRKPDRIIGTDYLHRWHLIPRSRFFNIYLHKFIGSDDDRALHEHPWWSVSFFLAGGPMRERFQHNPPGSLKLYRTITRFRPYFRNTVIAHQMVKDTREPSWTLFITGPRVRLWGFWCPKGWVPWFEFVDRDQGGEGKGCE